MFVVGKPLVDAVRNVVHGERLSMAVAYWGEGAFRELGLPDTTGDTAIVCDLLSGCCNPRTIQRLLDGGYRLFDLPGLHAKVYVSNAGAVVGSANASTNGLGNESDRLDSELEAADFSTQADQTREARAWLKRTLTRSKPVSKKDLPTVWRAWLTRPAAPTRGSFLEVLSEGRFKGPELRVAFYDEESPPRRLQKKIESSPLYDPNADYDPYWGTAQWKIRKQDLVLDVSRDGNKFYCGGVFRAFAVLPDVVFVVREEAPFGLSFPARDRRVLADAAKAAVEANKVAPDGELRDVDAFARSLFR